MATILFKRIMKSMWILSLLAFTSLNLMINRPLTWGIYSSGQHDPKATNQQPSSGMESTGNAAVGVRQICPNYPVNSVGHIRPVLDIVSWGVQEKRHPEVTSGGRWHPRWCIPRASVAVLVPYRARIQHLYIFINNIHTFLQRQNLDYGIYIIEQQGEDDFNRATLLNVGFKEAMKDKHWQCIVLHDVDHLPVHDRNMYLCPHAHPRHLAASVDKSAYQLPYPYFFGGVTTVSSHMYRTTNGMSNKYWGWGGEDDDFFYRCVRKRFYPILRYPPHIGRYITLKRFHHSAKINMGRAAIVWRTIEGLNDKKDGLADLNYNLTTKTYGKLFTYMMADIGKQPYVAPVNISTNESSPSNESLTTVRPTFEPKHKDLTHRLSPTERNTQHGDGPGSEMARANAKQYQMVRHKEELPNKQIKAVPLHKSGSLHFQPNIHSPRPDSEKLIRQSQPSKFSNTRKLDTGKLVVTNNEKLTANAKLRKAEMQNRQYYEKRSVIQSRNKNSNIASSGKLKIVDEPKT